jgi:hypothetical protein
VIESLPDRLANARQMEAAVAYGQSVRPPGAPAMAELPADPLALRDRWLDALTKEQAEALLDDWKFVRRPAQATPVRADPPLVVEHCQALIDNARADVAAGLPDAHTELQQAWALTLAHGAGTGFEDLLWGWLYDMQGYPFR